ncbi:MAG: hotdog fold domain-containing protein [Gammaproteobacteria bacterium]
MSSEISTTLATYQRVSRWPAGHAIFSRMVCWRAPYFGSIRPHMTHLSAERAEVIVRKRRRVQNHIGTVHAIAMANACEFVAGLLCEAATPRASRWIPRGMNIEYRAKALTDIRTVAVLSEPIQTERAYNVVIPVDVMDDDDNIVVHADITMYVTPKPPRGNA